MKFALRWIVGFLPEEIALKRNVFDIFVDVWAPKILARVTLNTINTRMAFVKAADGETS